ncbi:MAG: hypothetical protein G8345_06655 [Magnetococcales bacterium]|nr:hypothetical protein [Magnetococcales bacterium]NGZ26552.1 hypothetical protein [Magnetococcales bacterium]
MEPILFALWAVITLIAVITGGRSLASTGFRPYPSPSELQQKLGLAAPTSELLRPQGKVTVTLRQEEKSASQLILSLTKADLPLFQLQRRHAWNAPLAVVKLFDSPGSGDKLFDENYLALRHASTPPHLWHHPAACRAARELLDLGFHEIAHPGLALSAICTDTRHLHHLDQHGLNQAADALWQVGNNLPTLKEAAPAGKPRGSRWRVGLSLTGWFVVFLIGMMILAVFGGETPLKSHSGATLPWVLVSLLVATPLATLNTRRLHPHFVRCSPSTACGMAIHWVGFFIMTTLLCYFTLDVCNWRLDDAPAREESWQVVEIHAPGKKSSPRLTLHQKESDRYHTLEIRRNLYEHMRPGATILLLHRPGFLGEAWVDSLVDRTAVSSAVAQKEDPAVVEQAKELVAAGQTGSAISLLQEHLIKQPGHFHACLLLDELLFPLGRFEEIRHAWDGYLALFPNDQRAYKERAGTKQYLNDPQGVFADMNQACQWGNRQACEWLKTRQKHR